MATFKNWPNDLKIAWSKDTNVFEHSNQIIFFFLPWVILFFVFLFRTRLGKIKPQYKKYIYNLMGAFAIIWELWFDIASVAAGNSATEQFWSGFDLCRLNTYLIGVFLLFRKVEWVKWIVATALWGGVSTLFNHYDKQAQVHSLITHAIILPTFPAIAVSMAGTNYSFKSYVYAHLFNWSIVLFLIATNYGLDRHAGELREDHLADNALVGWAPYGLRMILWILVVMVIEFCYFMLFRYIFWKTYEPKTGIRFQKDFIFADKKIYSFKIYTRERFWSVFQKDVKTSLKDIPQGPKRTYVALQSNIIKLSAEVESRFKQFKK